MLRKFLLLAGLALVGILVAVATTTDRRFNDCQNRLRSPQFRRPCRDNCRSR